MLHVLFNLREQSQQSLRLADPNTLPHVLMISNTFSVDHCRFRQCPTLLLPPNRCWAPNARRLSANTVHSLDHDARKIINTPSRDRCLDDAEFRGKNCHCNSTRNCLDWTRTKRNGHRLAYRNVTGDSNSI